MKKTILVVDDSFIDRRIIIALLGNQYDYIEAQTGHEAISILEKRHREISLVLIDLVIEDVEELAVLKWLKRQPWSHNMPTIALASNGCDPLRLESAYMLGVNDYLTRPFAVHSVRQRIYNTLNLTHKASHDALTDLYNRDAVEQYVERSLNLNTHIEYAMVMLDIDHFKEINDSRGHAFGDTTLVNLATRMRALLGPNDVAARIGGDEFIIFMPVEDELDHIAKRLQDQLKWNQDGTEIHCSLGIASSKESRVYKGMLQCADRALYIAKGNGRNQYAVYGTQNKSVEEKNNLTEDDMHGLGNMMVLNEQTLPFIHRVTDSMPGGFVIYQKDANLTLIHVNEVAISMYGCETEQEFRKFTENSFEGMVLPADLPQVQQAISLQINGRNKNFDTVEFRIRRKDGDLRWVENHGRLIHTSTYGDVFYVFIKDITEAVEQRLQQTAGTFIPMQEVKKPRILLAASEVEHREALASILSGTYEIVETDGIDATVDCLVNGKQQLDMILLDVEMSGNVGMDILQRLKAFDLTDKLPVMLVFGENTSTDMAKAFSLGAVDYVSRPYDMDVVRQRIKNALELYKRQSEMAHKLEQQTFNIQNLEQIVGMLSHIMEYRSGGSGRRISQIKMVTMLLLQRLLLADTAYKISNEEAELIALASTIHDIGNLMVPERYLNKPWNLSEEEAELVKTHTVQGAKLLSSLPHFDNERLTAIAWSICQWHHERWDGSGYPDHLQGDSIPIAAQIVGLADAYCALTGDKAYRSAISHSKAIDMIVAGECGAFNPVLIECLRDCETEMARMMPDV